MADMTFNTTAGQTVDRELLIAYLNTGETGDEDHQILMKMNYEVI